MKTDRYRLERILEIGNQLQDVMNRREITAEEIERDFETQWGTLKEEEAWLWSNGSSSVPT